MAKTAQVRPDVSDRQPSGRGAEDSGDRHDGYRVSKRALGGAIVVAVAIIAGLVVAYLLHREPSHGRPSPAGPPAATVSVARAESELWPVEISATGAIAAIQGIDVTAEVAGKVSEIAFEPGGHVKNGEFLVALDTRTERAALRALEAQLKKARADEARAARLVRRGTIAEAEYEQAVADAEVLQAQVDQQKTVIAHKTITAPFAGEVGIRRISIGELISPGDPIVTLQAIKPIFVNFTVPERHSGRLEVGQTVKVRVAAHPDRVFTGEVTAIDPKVTERTRSIAVQALLANEDRHLRPGMFADVTIDLGADRQVVAIPATAVTFNAFGKSVFFARPVDGTDGAGDRQKWLAERAFVETGERRKLMIEVVKGVEAGDRVVTAGQLKIDDGFPISISETDALAQVDPQPDKP